ncbi:MAG: hypothetical protein QFX36_03980 [Archaeoglobales archaeon]|nr:hypothetical protein [Archaeoglobales archaeon]
MASLKLKVEAMDEKGNIIAERCKDGDLFTKNWGAFMAGTLKLLFNSLHSNTYIAIAENGTAYYFGQDGNTYSDYGWRSCPITQCDGKPIFNQSVLAVGSGIAQPTIDDYKLKAELARTPASAPTLLIENNTIKIRFSATFSFSSQQTVSEAGIYLYLYCTISRDRSYFLVARDVFNPVQVPAGGSITIIYEIVFNQ